MFLSHLSKVLLFSVLVLLFLPAPALSDGYKVGFRTLGFSIPQSGFRLDVNVWYPSTRNPRELTYAPWTISAAREGRLAEGKFPLLILSHPSPGTRFSYHDTCAWLASQGYIIAAPTHAQDCMDNMKLLFTWNQMQTRAADIRALIDFLPKHKELGPGIDAQSIGLIGFGAGGTCALLLGGAQPDCITWPDYCPKAGKNDIYCNPWSREKMNGICREFPLKKPLTDPRIRAIAIISPGFGMLFSPYSFRDFHTPLLIVAAEKDNLNKSRFHADVFAGYLRERSRVVLIPGADLGAFMAPCPDSLSHELSELCRSVTAKERQVIHRKMWDALSSFFWEVFRKWETEPVREK